MTSICPSCIQTAPLAYQHSRPLTIVRTVVSAALPSSSQAFEGSFITYELQNVKSKLQWEDNHVVFKIVLGPSVLIGNLQFW